LPIFLSSAGAYRPFGSPNYSGPAGRDHPAKHFLHEIGCRLGPFEPGASMQNGLQGYVGALRANLDAAGFRQECSRTPSQSPAFWTKATARRDRACEYNVL